MAFDNFLKDKLLKREAEGLLRKLSLNDNLIDFCSNDYLGWSRDENLKKKVLSRFSESQYRLGSSGSRLISGNTLFIEELEQKIASYHKAESALIFNSGYDANVGFFSCVPAKGDTVIYDELIHASIRDGIRLGLAKSYSFVHNDLEDLKKKIKLAQGNVFVAVEAVYSMDGDEAPLKELCDLGVNLIVDEAHSMGVYSEYGEGLVVKFGLENKVYARLVTYGKAFGAHGAAVLGSSVLRNYLVNFARSFIYTTAGSEFHLLTIDEIYNQKEELRKRISKVHELNNYFLKGVKEIENKFILSSSLIHCLVVGNNNACMKIESVLRSQKFAVKAILSPTVPKNKERIRLSIHYHNDFSEIKDLLEVLKENIVNLN